MKTGTMKIEVDYDDNGSPLDVRVSGEASGEGQLCVAAALIDAASQGAGVTLRSGVYLMAQLVEWNWLRDTLLDSAMDED